MIIWIHREVEGKIIEQRAVIVTVDGVITTVRLLENSEEIQVQPSDIIGVEIFGFYTITFKKVGYFTKNKHEYPDE